MEKEMTK
ncbi:hypothetical protein EC960932_4388, partial [Escherichia coli 96.0932]